MQVSGERRASGPEGILRGLDFPRRDGGLLVVRRELGGLGRDTLKNIYIALDFFPLKKNPCNNSPLTNEFRMDMARFEIPVSGWTCFRTKTGDVSKNAFAGPASPKTHTLVDVGGIGLRPRLGALLLLASRSRLLAGILLLRSLGGSGGGLGGGLLVGRGGHFENTFV